MKNRSAIKTIGGVFVALNLCMGMSSHAMAAFSSGSSGTDGALDFSWAASGSTIIFDPADYQTFDPVNATRQLDVDNDNVFHFTSINIPANVTVQLKASKLNWRPVYWLATGDITINGTLNLNGAVGHGTGSGLEDRYPAEPGPGGFSGGLGASAVNPAQAGYGPGAGTAVGTNGGGGSHAVLGSGNTLGTYGSPYLIPIIGGSGGAGYGGPNEQVTSRPGGGAGGGAIVLASSTQIVVNGSIKARGGNGVYLSFNNISGGGSGGAIRILSPTISGAGSIDVSGGAYGDAGGRVRIESNVYQFTGSFLPANSANHIRISGLIDTTPFLPSDPLVPAWPSIRVASINGVALPDEPSGTFSAIDASIDTSTAVEVLFESFNIPTDANLTLTIVSPFDEVPNGILTVTPTYNGVNGNGRDEWSGSVAFPIGFSKGYVQATWTPAP